MSISNGLINGNNVQYFGFVWNYWGSDKLKGMYEQLNIALITTYELLQFNFIENRQGIESQNLYLKFGSTF